MVIVFVIYGEIVGLRYEWEWYGGRVLGRGVGGWLGEWNWEGFYKCVFWK